MTLSILRCPALTLWLAAIAHWSALLLWLYDML